MSYKFGFWGVGLKEILHILDVSLLRGNAAQWNLINLDTLASSACVQISKFCG